MSVHVVDDGPVRVVAIARPEVRNAVDRETAERLEEVFVAFDADEDAKVGVLTGEGGTFCAGADLGAIARGEPNRLAPDGPGPMGPTRLALSKPVIAAIEGYAVAGGFELALWCDLRVVAEDATLGVFCRRFGVPLVDGGTLRLPRLIGQSRALDLILTGRPVDAQEALAIGLANRVVPSGTALSAAIALAKELSQLPQVCLHNDRRAVYELFGVPDAQAWPIEHALGVESLAADGLKGARAFRAGKGRHGSALAKGQGHSG
jgi:enoyl-CoA hydratase